MRCVWVWSLLILIKFQLVSALSCHFCAQNRSFSFEVQVLSPRFCKKHQSCEGGWCVQHLRGNNLSYYCVDKVHLTSPFPLAPSINSFCHAFYVDNDGMNALCYCRNKDYCNKSSPAKPLLYIILTTTFIFLFLDK